ncbi:PREDICTED: disease resistance protein TAO1-like [Camelina sativa]|uniref:ADP-ribosyl cyclase/cyclic ADP-ribose hydrolase n=1 Tax=Camelina sativa TaxID=90675 RepID=A0ABM1QBR1_CAMSA|nr:PREDICTED: disease resistance protein TAO1-like [Camelina sativa]
MASLPSSSPSSSAVWKTDVFVSFRGEDVRKTFVSHLLCELDRMGINAFRDDLDLQRGKSISPELVDAIKGSRFAIVVISRNYAASSWCLDEVLKIMECEETVNQTVLPIFYEVDPSDVRRQKGGFGEDVESHSDKEKVRKWKEALTRLASISGEDSRNWRDESKMIKKIVKDISDKLVSTLYDDSEELIGMSSHMDFLQSMMSMEDEEDVRMVGIWGMGGVGKTTIAKSYTINSHVDFKLIASWRIMFQERDKEAWSSVSCCSMIKERLRHKRVLIVLDDVDRSEQLDELVKEIDWFGPGSRIIVTTRDRHLLVSHGINLELSVQAINYASGLPLALRVLGSFLYRRSRREWQSTLSRLKTYPQSDIMEVLRVSFDGLDEQEKAIFLYISCFYNMKHVDYVTKLLDICGYAAEIGIKILTEKSLIVVSNGCIKMHDLLEQMGRELVRQQAANNPAQRLLLWNPEDICELLSEISAGTQLVEGISLNVSEIPEVFASDRAFEGLSNLKLLNFYDLSFDGETRVHLPNGLSYLPRKLRYLRWDGYPLKTMPSRFCPEFLVELCMSNSKLEKLWDGIQPLRNLKKMDLSRSKYLVEIPDLSKAPNLEEVNLSCCQNLVEVTPSIKNLKRLSCIYLTNCIQLQNIPVGITLKSLETVGMSGCSSLMQFPELSWNTRRLYLSSTKIEELPSSISHLSYLVELDMSDCQRLRVLPSSVRNLVSLKSMNLDGCKHLENLPDTLQSLTSLETLEVSGCLNVNEFPRVATNIEVLLLAIGNSFYTPEGLLHSLCPPLSRFDDLRVLSLSNMNMIEIPNSIGNLWSLLELDLSGNNFEFIPASIKRLTKLNRLNLNNCQRLQALPDELPRGLLYIYIHSCTSLVSISGSFNQYCLRKLVASNCYKLDQAARILIHRNMRLESAKPEHSYFPGSDVPTCFNHQVMGSSLNIHLPQSKSSDILGFSACIMIGVDGKYPMNNLKIHCSCILKDADACELIVMDEVWYPDPKAFTNMYFGSDHLLLFSRTCMSMGAYNEALFEFSIENTEEDSFSPVGVIKKCAVHLISFKDMMQEFSTDSEKIQSSDLDISKATDDARVLKRRAYEAEFLHKEQPNPKRVKFRPIPLARKGHSKLYQPNGI